MLLIFGRYLNQKFLLLPGFGQVNTEYYSVHLNFLLILKDRTNV